MALDFPDADTSDIDRAIIELNQRVLAANQELGNRQTKLENALLACGKFRDALQSLLDWLAETRELIENQGPIAATDPNVMKAQMQEQKVTVICVPSFEAQNFHFESRCIPEKRVFSLLNTHGNSASID